VVDTLTAGVWCLLTTKNYRETVLKAVNLGGDTDTTGIVAGGLAGIHEGLAAVPENWRTAMARAGDLTILFEQFAAIRLELPVTNPINPPARIFSTIILATLEFPLTCILNFRRTQIWFCSLKARNLMLTS
jgi:hypothetical protein